MISQWFQNVKKEHLPSIFQGKDKDYAVDEDGDISSEYYQSDDEKPEEIEVTTTTTTTVAPPPAWPTRTISYLIVFVFVHEYLHKNAKIWTDDKNFNKQHNNDSNKLKIPK